MPRTIRRQPFSVSTNGNDYPQTFSFTHAEFKGICDNKNDIAVESTTFADASNVYLDDNSLLISRPPFKFEDGEKGIVEQWRIGDYGFRLYRILGYENGENFAETDDVNREDLCFKFVLRCTTHDVSNELSMIMLAVDWEFSPKVTLAQVEDKIFVWFGGVSFSVLNIKTMRFEDGTNHLYLPIHKLVTNGIESDFETKNFLTNAYRRRYQYSALSSVNFEKLVGRNMSVGVNNGMTQDTSKHLYDINVQQNQDKMLIYPYSPVGNDYHVDVVQTPRAMVILRHSAVLHTIEISFDGKYFKPLPRLDNILGEPMLTRDGLHVVAFTKSGVAQYKLVAQSTEDIATDISTWITKPYLERNLDDGIIVNGTVNSTFTPSGYFETIDQFAYVASTDIGLYLYTEYLDGTNGKQWGSLKLIESDESDTILNDDIKVYAKYVAPTIEHNELSMVVSIIAAKTSIQDGSNGEIWSKNCLLNYYFTRVPENTNRALREGDKISLVDREGTLSISGYVYKIDGTRKNIVNDGADILPGDVLLYTDLPIEYDDAPYYVDAVYKKGDIVKYPSYKEGVPHIYRCLAPTDLPPTNNVWEELGSAFVRIGYFGVDLRSVYVTRKVYDLLSRRRYVVEGTNTQAGLYVKFKPETTNVIYSATDLDDIAETVYVYESIDVNGPDLKKLSEIYPDGRVVYPVRTDHTGYLQIEGVGNPAEYKRRRYHTLSYNNNKYQDFLYPAHNMDLSIDVSITENSLFCNTYVAYNIAAEKNISVDTYRKIVYNYTTNISSHQRKTVQKSSSYFKIMPGTENVLTDLYAYIDGEVIEKPNLFASQFIYEKERVVSNKDSLSLLSDDLTTVLFTGNIHKVKCDYELEDYMTVDWFSFSSESIKSGDIVLCVKNAHSKNDFLQIESYSGPHNFFYIEKMIDGEVVSGHIHITDTIRLRPLPYLIVFPDYSIDGSTSDAYAEPRDKTYTGVVVLSRLTQPLAFTETGVWYNIDGTIWSSQLNTDTIIELDEYIESEYIDGKPVFSPNLIPPDFHKTLNEQYFAYNTADGNSLQVSQTKRDENKMFAGEYADFLLYLPKRNEQLFVNKITNLHPLSDTEMGIFTDSELWYISTIISQDGSVFYTKPILSKTPAGCRYGSDVITALDGQALIFPTPRGISALAPQNFIATTEKSLSYLSDAIQEKYNNFYHDPVNNVLRTLNDAEPYAPEIKIVTYKYWILFHKYMDREILVLDTRNGGWWSWTTPYPIKSLTVGSRLHVLMQIDFSPVGEAKPSLGGVSYIFADREASIVTDKTTEFPELGDTPIANIGYHDDVVEKSLSGLSELIYENEFVGYRHLIKYASPVIDWHFTSQKLHFGQINNYKTIKGFTVNIKGDETFVAKISTKAFRDVYHPEQSSVIEVKVNDLRTFVKRLNLMHTIDFQYKFENDAEAEIASQLKLNALSIKYEVKENIR